MYCAQGKKRGFTLTELVVGIAVFVVVAMSIYAAYTNLFRFMNSAQYNELAIDVAEERMEIIRNMPYADVGVEGSIPSGNVPYEQTITRSNIPFKITAIIRNIDLPFDGTAGGTPNDTNPADNKLVSLTVTCPTCAYSTPLTVVGQIAPLSLENIGNTGSLFIHVYDASGNPIQSANVKTTGNLAPITINDITNSSGLLALVGIPPGTNAYHVLATKSGYSTDESDPDPNISTGMVTPVDLFIDKLSILNISSVSPTCSPIANYNFNLKGSKLYKGALKYDEDLETNSSGVLNISDMEWDTAYTVTPTDTSYDLAGQNPLSPLALNPGSEVNMQLIAVPKDPKSVMVSVTDASTGLPLSGVTVTFTYGTYNESKVTGQGYLSQSDWSLGSGQDLFVDEKKYWLDDSNIDTTTNPGDIRLRNSFGSFSFNGYLESSTFDTGSVSNFYNFIWSPNSEPASTSVKLQFATAASSTPDGGWIYTGPDGTSGSYFTVSNSSFDSSLNGKQYARYKVFLETATSTASPSISDVGFTYTSSCIPPGQVLFHGLTLNSYTYEVSKTGYNTVTGTVNVGPDWQELKVPLSVI